MRVQLCSQNNENTEVNAREVRFSERKCTFQKLAIWIRGEMDCSVNYIERIA